MTDQQQFGDELQQQHRLNDARMEELKQEAKKDPLVSEEKSLLELEGEYADNPAFVKHIQKLGDMYGKIRRIRKDGCCFYRSYLFGIIEYLLQQREERIPAFAALLESKKDLLAAAGYEWTAIEFFVEALTDTLAELQSCAANECTNRLMAAFNDEGVCNCITFVGRCLTATHLKLNADMFEPFLEGHANIIEYCSKEVDPMFVEAEQFQIMALSAILDYPVAVCSITANMEPVTNVFPEGREPVVHLLYRPGHYDLIYKKH
eukprot:GDKI01009651.1.p1 GENE.GDKI01009651.1~~GDKI01009651.1.p1  ORF type:complete len:262 (+),score=65.88 GDKI01009651.1:56-841(+)